MQSLRSRMNSVLRRPSFSGKSDQSGNESDAPSRKSSGDKDKDHKRIHRKRVSFSPRSRSGTADTYEQSQLARQVVDATNLDKPASLSDAKPEAVVAALPLDSSVEYTKAESPVEGAADEQQLQQPVEEVVAKEYAAEPVEEVVQAPTYQAEAVEPTEPAQVEQVVAPAMDYSMPMEQPEYSKQTATDVLASLEDQEPSYAPAKVPMTPETKINDLEASYHVVMQGSPKPSTLNVALEESTQSAPEPANYDTSFASTSSVPELPLSMPVPRPTGQPLSAIDELRAKTHPLADWSQKDDVNYDADEYVRVMTMFFLLPAVLFIGIPFLFPHTVLELGSL